MGERAMTVFNFKIIGRKGDTRYMGQFFGKCIRKNPFIRHITLQYKQYQNFFNFGAKSSKMNRN